jgi:hypothetical protein
MKIIWKTNRSASNQDGVIAFEFTSSLEIILTRQKFKAVVFTRLDMDNKRDF